MKNFRKQLGRQVNYLAEEKLSMNNYWKERKNCKYYQKVISIINKIAKTSIIDVGSSNTELHSFVGSSYEDRACLDIHKLPAIKGVRTIRANFYKWSPDKRYDVVSCLQVLEHLDDPKAFAQKLFDLGETVIISVPYKWKKGFCIHHVQDPVDEAKLFLWTQTVPDEKHIIEDFGVERLICVYKKKALKTKAV